MGFRAIQIQRWPAVDGPPPNLGPEHLHCPLHRGGLWLVLDESVGSPDCRTVGCGVGPRLLLAADDDLLATCLLLIIRQPRCTASARDHRTCWWRHCRHTRPCRRPSTSEQKFANLLHWRTLSEGRGCVCMVHNVLAARCSCMMVMVVMQVMELVVLVTARRAVQLRVE